MTAPDFIWAGKDEDGAHDWSVDRGLADKYTPYLRHAPAALAADPLVMAMVGAVIEEAAKVAQHRHLAWDGGNIDVNCDFTACADIAAAIRAMKGEKG